MLLSIENGIKELREVCTLYKSDLYLVPRPKEAEFRAKYDTYIDKISKYEHNAKKLELVIKNDEVGLLELKHGYDEEKAKTLNGATQALV